MFWISFVVLAMSTLLVKLGAVSVMAGILLMALKASAVVILALAGIALWRWYK